MCAGHRSHINAGVFVVCSCADTVLIARVHCSWVGHAQYTQCDLGVHPPEDSEDSRPSYVMRTKQKCQGKCKLKRRPRFADAEIPVVCHMNHRP